jgi:hypothetical protein
MHFAKGTMDEKQRLYYDTLRAMALEQHEYKRNFVVFASGDARFRDRFIAHIERQSEAGLPFAVKLVQEVMRQRLKA